MQAGLYPYGLQLVWMTTTNFHLPYILSQFPWSLLRENTGENPLLWRTEIQVNDSGVYHFAALVLSLELLINNGFLGFG